MRAAAVEISVSIEESPDCTEQGVLLKRRMSGKRRPGKTSATEKIPPELPVRVKRWGKSPPGDAERRADGVNSSRSKTK